jgi:hypothetical protein
MHTISLGRAETRSTATADDMSIAQQMTTIEAELQTVRDLCEAKWSRLRSAADSAGAIDATA